MIDWVFFFVNVRRFLADAESSDRVRLGDDHGVGGGRRGHGLLPAVPARRQAAALGPHLHALLRLHVRLLRPRPGGAQVGRTVALNAKQQQQQQKNTKEQKQPTKTTPEEERRRWRPHQFHELVFAPPFGSVFNCFYYYYYYYYYYY